MRRSLVSIVLLAATPGLAAVPQGASLSASATVTTAIAAPSGGDLNANVPKQVPLPPKQAWCPSEIFCAGAVSLERT